MANWNNFRSPREIMEDQEIKQENQKISNEYDGGILYWIITIIIVGIVGGLFVFLLNILK